MASVVPMLMNSEALSGICWGSSRAIFLFFPEAEHVPFVIVYIFGGGRNGCSAMVSTQLALFTERVDVPADGLWSNRKGVSKGFNGNKPLDLNNW